MVCGMKTKRIGVGCAVINRMLYAVGGFDGQHRLSSVERYHPENDEWCFVQSMQTARSGAGEGAPVVAAVIVCCLCFTREKRQTCDCISFGDAVNNERHLILANAAPRILPHQSRFSFGSIRIPGGRSADGIAAVMARYRYLQLRECPWKRSALYAKVKLVECENLSRLHSHTSPCCCLLCCAEATRKWSSVATLFALRWTSAT